MRIASWNVNSVKARLPNIMAWVGEVQPDVLLLQEIKCVEEQFPLLEFQGAGYSCHIAGQKAYHGVALLSRLPVTDVVRGLTPDDPEDGEARFVAATIGGVRVASLYLPNGNPRTQPDNPTANSPRYTYKLAWMARLKAHMAALLQTETPFVFGGDYNVIPEAMDARSPQAWIDDALYHPTTRKAWREMINLGITDAFRALHPATQNAYSFWDYQAGAWPRDEGIRIDHFLLSPDMMDKLTACTIDRAPRGLDKASDHTPIFIDIADRVGQR